jgi:hypothetical protein
LEERAELGRDKVRVETFIIFSMLCLISRRHLRGSGVAYPYERDKTLQYGIITGLDEAPNLLGSNGKFAIVI